MKVYRLFFIVLVLFSNTGLSSSLQLGPRSYGNSFKLFIDDDVTSDFNEQLTVDERMWLQDNPTLHVGVVSPLTPPFELVTSKNNFEGISADLLSMLSMLANVKIKLHHYQDQHQALSALAKNQIQIISINAILQNDMSNLAKAGWFTKEIIKSGHVYLLGDNNNKPDATERATIAYEVGSLDYNHLKKIYPLANIVAYDNAAVAFDAVLFGEADYLAASRLVGRYLNGGRFGNLSLLKKLEIKNKPLAFFVGNNNPQALSVINTFINVFQQHGLYSNLDLRWRGGMGSEPLNLSEELTTDEYKSIKEREIRVGLIKNNLPFSFIDNKGQWRGVIIDILEHVSVQTGIKFYESAYDRFEDAEQALLKKEVDIIGSVSEHVPNGMYLTSLYYNSDDILVEIVTNDKLSDKQIIYGVASSNRQEVESSRVFKNKNVSLSLYDTDFDVLQDLEAGEINYAVVSLYSSEYYRNISSRPFKILRALNGSNIERVFSVRNEDHKLLRIINASLSLSLPSELAGMAYKWRYGPKPYIGFWAQYKRIIIPISLMSLLLILTYIYYSYRLAKALKYRKQAEVKLISQLDLMQGFVNGIPHPVALLGSQLNIIFKNKSFDDEFGLNPQENIRNLTDVMSSEDIARISGSVNSAISENSVLTHELQITIADRARDIQDWFIPYEDVTDSTKGVFWGWFDVTWRNEAYATAMQARTEAEQANKAKSEFIATISHEIRTPLNIINGFLEILNNSKSLTSIERQELMYIRNASNSLLELVGDVLDVTKIESGLLTINFTASDIYSIINDAVKVFKLASSEKGIILVDEILIDSPCWGMVDSLRFRQVFYNLLSNAVKFTQHGTITVSVQLADGKLYVRVQDTGIGIASDKLGTLFKPFVQAHMDGNIKGSGLGLNISRRLCELMGGGISISSVKGKGTTAEFYIPYEETKPVIDLEESVSAYKNTGCGVSTIVIVDDHPVNLLLLEKQLTTSGYKVFKADTAIDVMKLLSEESIDAILTDCQMPEIDGFELAQLIREKESRNELEHRHIIIGLTASGLELDKLKAIECGMDDCLFKPIDRVSLSKAFEPYQNQVCREDSYDNPHIVISNNNDEILHMVQSSSLEDLMLAREALACFNVGALSSLIHRIKGVYLMFGNKEIVSVCKLLEENIQKNIDSDFVNQNLNVLERLINES
ncbi:ATP-binding protein [Aeromonas veronii]|uniref:ATP-binding protein n=1 Tax=Aeromonas veronii TaxID=654 RepID=UPI0031FE2414